jgi:GT2 family glycosyltransferase
MNPKVCVVILNLNGRHHLADCLGTLAGQTWRDFEVILVDNGSTDGSADWVEEYFPQVRVIRNETNLGFAGGNNQAIRASKSEYIATLNNDTRVHAGWLAELVAVAEKDLSIGMCSSKMLFADRPQIINTTGICLDPVGIAWDRRGGESDDDQEPEPVEVFGACAGAALYRRAMLDQIGLFDESFLAYLGDVDLAWRGRLAGWRCMYVPASRVLHVHSATLGEGSPQKNRLLGRNKVWTIAKNYPTGRGLLYLPLILLYDLAAVSYALLARGNIDALLGRLAGLRGLPKVLLQRRSVQALREKNQGEPWHRFLSPLEPPWKVPARYTHLRGGE